MIMDYKKTYNDYLKCRKKTYDEAINVIKEACKDGELILMNDEDDEDYIPFYVTYDGGNHPEYNSTPFSPIFSIFLKDGEVYLNTEDESEYDISRIDDDETIELANYIFHLTNNE